jgi:hypothetical protein
MSDSDGSLSDQLVPWQSRDFCESFIYFDVSAVLDFADGQGIQ